MIEVIGSCFPDHPCANTSQTRLVWKIKIELTPQEGEDIGAEGLDDVVPGNTKRPHLKKTYQDLRFLYFPKLDNSISTLINLFLVCWSLAELVSSAFFQKAL